MKLDAYETTDKGSRDENQDNLAYTIVGKKDEGVFIVADGLGGHRGGAIASKTAVDAVLAVPLKEDPHWDQPDWVRVAVHRGNAAVFKIASDDLNLSSMRTTIVILQIRDGKAYWANVGDSRLYHLRDHKIIARTMDDTVVEVLRSVGEIEEDQMRHHPDRSRLLKALGGELETEFKAQTEGVPLMDNDRFILCSDGMWEWISREDIEKFSRENPTSKELGSVLQKEVLKNSNADLDNIAICTITVQLDEWAENLEERVNKKLSETHI